MDIKGQGVHRVSLGAVVRETIRAKAASNMRPAYISSLRYYLGAFARGREDMPLSEVTMDTVARWFDERQEKPRTMLANIGRLSAMFQVAWRRGWIEVNPCDRMEKPRVDYQSPEILTVGQSRTLLEAALKTRWSAYLVLCLLCGLRPNEARQTTWEDISTDRGMVEVRSAASKMRRRRYVHLRPSAIDWLRHCPRQELPLSKSGVRAFTHFAIGTLGLTRWPQDVLRHTCATYWLADIRDAGKVAHELGNSPGILMRHYCDLVTKEQAEEFWAIRPVNGRQIELEL